MLVLFSEYILEAFSHIILCVDEYEISIFLSHRSIGKFEILQSIFFIRFKCACNRNFAA